MSCLDLVSSLCSAGFKNRCGFLQSINCWAYCPGRKGCLSSTEVLTFCLCASVVISCYDYFFTVSILDHTTISRLYGAWPCRLISPLLILQILKGNPERTELLMVKPREIRRKVFDRKVCAQDRDMNVVSMKDIVRVLDGHCKVNMSPLLILQTDTKNLNSNEI